MTHLDSTASGDSPQAAKSGYGFLASIMDGIDDAELLDALQQTRLIGRPGYPFRSMWRAWLCKYILRIRYNVELVDRLRGSSRLREVCGFSGSVPSESTFCRFFSRLADYQPIVEQCLTTITDRIGGKLPDFGKIVAADATVFETYGNPDRKTVQGNPCGDMDARWGHKNSVKTKDKEHIEWCFGYKLHAISDALYGIPLGFVLTAANASESPLLPKVVRKAQAAHKWLKPRFLLADRGYDSDDNFRFLYKREITPVIHIRKPSNNRELHRGIYTPRGSPTCQGEKEMQYISTDPDSGHHLFRCPDGGCPLKAMKGVHYCADEVWENSAEEPRIVGTLPRASPLWKKLYKMRWSIERVFRSMKHSRNLDQHCFRGMRKVLLHSTLSALTYTATALARLNAGDGKRMRLMRVNAP